LKSQGGEAFKPHHYGNSIIIERKITANGESSYKLKNESGAIISRNKDELLAITDYFTIQVLLLLPSYRSIVK